MQIKPKRHPDTIRVVMELKSLDEAGRFTGYAATFHVADQVNDILMPGCFDKTLAAWKGRGVYPRVKWRHWLTVGHTLEMTVDEKGLLVTGQLWMDDPDAQAVYAEVQSWKLKGIKPGMSFAFYVIEPATDPLDENEPRRITELELLDDITITPCPVNTDTEIIELKSGDNAANSPTVRDAEFILRDAGISRGAAKRILAKSSETLRDAETECLEPGLSEILSALQRANGKDIA